MVDKSGTDKLLC